MKDFPQMVEIVPEGAVGRAKVEHFTVDEAASRFSGFRRGDLVPPGRYARLYVDGRLMMSDTSMERQTNVEAVRRANGKVLIAGLGIGMILSPILEDDSVTSVVVVEKSADVAELVTPHFPSPKLSVVVADILDWRPPKGEKFDAVYFDIWPDICTDNLDEINKLHRAFRARLNRDNPSAWMGSWMHEAIKARRKRERREESRYAWRY